VAKRLPLPIERRTGATVLRGASTIWPIAGLLPDA